MNKPWKVVLAFTAIFLAGAVFGGLLAIRVGPRLFQKRNGPPPPASPAVLRHLTERLDLTAAQKEKIRPLVDRAEEEIRPITERYNEAARPLRQQSIKDTGAIVRRLQQEISSELTPDQRKKLEKMKERQRELMREDRPGGQMFRERMNEKRDGSPQSAPPVSPSKTEPAKL
jgi:Spy/CpxP family protein refolding chaperone